VVGSSWVSAHVFHQGDLDRLLVEAVAPLVDELAATGLADRYFFLRYWDGGPHLRLRVLPVDDTVRAEVSRRVVARLTDHLRRAPSTPWLTPERYARAAERLGRRENLSAYARRLAPTDTVRLVPYRREHLRYGPAAAMAAVERHFAESSRIALRVLALGVPDVRRQAAGAAVTLLSWWIGGADPRAVRGATLVDEPADAVGMPALARRMRALAGAAPAVAHTGTLVDWARSGAALRTELAHRYDAGQAVRVPLVLDLCGHLFCNRLGLSTATEDHLRRLAATAYGVVAAERS
jgi:hypothetical protein